MHDGTFDMELLIRKAQCFGLHYNKIKEYYYIAMEPANESRRKQIEEYNQDYDLVCYRVQRDKSNTNYYIGQKKRMEQKEAKDRRKYNVIQKKYLKMIGEAYKDLKEQQQSLQKKAAVRLTQWWRNNKRNGEKTEANAEEDLIMDADPNVNTMVVLEPVHMLKEMIAN